MEYNTDKTNFELRILRVMLISNFYFIMLVDDLQKQIDDLINVPFNGSSAGSLPKNEDEFLSEENNNSELTADQAVEDKETMAAGAKEPRENNQTEKKQLPLYERAENESILKANKKNDSLLKNVASADKQEQLADKMVQLELARKEEQIKETALSQGLGYINLKGLPIIPEALRLIAEDESREKGIIAFMYKKGTSIRLAVIEYNNEVQKIISRLSEEHEGISVSVYLTSKVSMAGALKMYAALPKIIQHIDDVAILESDIEESAAELKDLKELAEKIKKVSITQVLSLILSAAIRVESSDIHLEAEESGINLRFRIDGVLHNIASLEREIWDKLVSRIKLSSKLKMNIKDKPQDGNFSVHIKGEPVDFRVSTLPTAYGESVAMRILYHANVEGINLDNLGIEEYNRKILDKELAKPNGMLVVAGPTGAGKTTTLYAILNKLNTADNKIITIEDPIEYKIKGINQSQVNKDRDYTFAKALRSLVRQDPDIILVGEIRDKETAEISLNAALTGHLLFTTLHSNDAIGAIPRFLALGAKPYLLAPALNISLAQRLIRKICENCRTEEIINETKKERIRQEMRSISERYRNLLPEDINNLKFYQGKGCERCAGLGYKGQIGIFEIFQVTDEIRDMILADNVSEHKMKELAVRNGMITMAQDGILKAIRGVTSLDEVFRVS